MHFLNSLTTALHSFMEYLLLCEILSLSVFELPKSRFMQPPCLFFLDDLTFRL